MPKHRAASAVFSCTLAAIWLIPLAWVSLTAFVPPVKTAKSAGRPIWDNFRIVLETAPFGRYFLNSLLIVGGILLVQFITITLAGYAFARKKFIGKDLVFVLLLLQIVIPNEILLVPNYQTIAALGLMDKLPGLMLPFFGSAFGIFLMRQSFKSIPRDFEETAAIDGCNLARLLWHVYLPMTKPAYVAFGIVSVSTHWNDYLWPLIITNSDNVRPMTVGLAMFATTFETGARWGEVSAATLLVSLPLVVLFMIFQKRFVESFMYSSGLK